MAIPFTSGSGTPEDFLRPRKTAAYRPNVWMSSVANGIIDGRPIFTWLDAERMKTDPQVTFGLKILRAPLYSATWKIKCKSTAVAEFIDDTLRRVWQRALRKILTGYHTYGTHGGEVTHAEERGLIRFAALDDFNPRDVRPLQFIRGRRRGLLAGIRIRNIEVAPGSDSSTNAAGAVDLAPPHAWWFGGDAEYGSFYGTPAIRGAFEPWEEKMGKGGAVDSRRLWFKKCAFRGGVMRHPQGVIDFGDATTGPMYKNAADLAREIVEKYENGGVLAMPNTKLADGSDYEWTFEPPGSNGEATGILEYPDELDEKILIGMGIPPELIAAATVGSGYSGRSIPAQMFFTTCDEILQLLIDALDRMIIRPLVRVNFGRVHYHILPASLAALVAKDASDAGKGGQPSPGGGTPSPGGQPTDTPPDQPEQPSPISLSNALRGSLRERVRQLAALEYPDLGAVNLSSAWSPYQGEKGGKGWRNGSTGEIRYQVEKPSDDEPDSGAAGGGKEAEQTKGLFASTKAILAKSTPAVKSAFKRALGEVKAAIADPKSALYNLSYVAMRYGVAGEILESQTDRDKGAELMSGLYSLSGHTNDPFRDATGGIVNAHSAMNLASSLIVKGIGMLKKSANLSDGDEELSPEDRAELISDLYNAVFEKLGTGIRMDSAKLLAAKKPPTAENLSWAAEKTKTGGIKAVGTAEHAGKVLYGDAARKALAQKDGNDKPSPQPAAKEPVAKPPTAKPPAAPKVAKPTKAQSKEAVAKAFSEPTKITADAAAALPTHLANMTVPELQAIKKQHSVGGDEKKKAVIVAKIHEHLKSQVAKVSTDGRTIDPEKATKEISNILADKSAMSTAHPDRVAAEVGHITRGMNYEQMTKLAKGLGVQGGLRDMSLTSLSEAVRDHARATVVDARKNYKPETRPMEGPSTQTRKPQGGGLLGWLFTGLTLGI